MRRNQKEDSYEPIPNPFSSKSSDSGDLEEEGEDYWDVDESYLDDEDEDHALSDHPIPNYNSRGAMRTGSAHGGSGYHNIPQRNAGTYGKLYEEPNSASSGKWKLAGVFFAIVLIAAVLMYPESISPKDNYVDDSDLDLDLDLDSTMGISKGFEPIAQGKNHTDTESDNNHATDDDVHNFVVDDNKPVSEAKDLMQTTKAAQPSEPCPAVEKSTKMYASYDPFEEEPKWYGSIFATPPYPGDSTSFGSTLGLLHSPCVFNGTLVFVTEGDIYVAYLPPFNARTPKGRALEGTPLITSTKTKAKKVPASIPTSTQDNQDSETKSYYSGTSNAQVSSNSISNITNNLEDEVFIDNATDTTITSNSTGNSDEKSNAWMFSSAKKNKKESDKTDGQDNQVESIESGTTNDTISEPTSKNVVQHMQENNDEIGDKEDELNTSVDENSEFHQNSGSTLLEGITVGSDTNVMISNSTKIVSSAKDGVSKIIDLDNEGIQETTGGFSKPSINVQDQKVPKTVDMEVKKVEDNEKPDNNHGEQESFIQKTHDIKLNDIEGKNDSENPLQTTLSPVKAPTPISSWLKEYDFDDEEPEVALGNSAYPDHVFGAMKLTTTVGNVQSPLISPAGDLIAFTATYTGTREAYVMSLSHRNAPAIRLTYLDSELGVMKIVGWANDGNSIVISAQSMEASLPHTRLYKLHLKRKAKDQEQEHRGNLYSALLKDNVPSSIGEIEPIPLSQAIDATISDDCIYFVRYRQSSNTARYIGGTTENLWAYCFDEKIAIAMTPLYRGTSKAPQIWTAKDGRKYLLFMSDRAATSPMGETIVPTSMNLFAMPLPGKLELYSSDFKPEWIVPLTSISCSHGGMPLAEYSVDTVRGDVILQIGADLNFVSSIEVESIIIKARSVHSSSKYQSDVVGVTSMIQSQTAKVQHVNIAVYSDFHSLQERRFAASLTTDMTSLDVFSTSFGEIKALLGLRGQAWVAPIINDDPPMPAFGGAGQNIPLRRYRVAPGSTVGGIVRVLAVKAVPNYGDKDFSLILATDPLSETAEQAFYLVECGGSMVPSFLTTYQLPTPFLGGHLPSGGSTRKGGLGSIYAETLEVSPCGRRAAWVDTDGRIMAMTIPRNITSTEEPPIVDIRQLKQVNNLKQPIAGRAELKWSPGGRYLAITHSAANQFSILSIADLGEPQKYNNTLAPMENVTIVQATPDRFNSFSPVWGRTAYDVKQAVKSDLPPKASVLYFLTDRDVILTDISSPWGTRAPTPYYPDHASVYALPLVTPKSDYDQDSADDADDYYDDDDFLPFGTFQGAGAAEVAIRPDGSVVSELDETNSTIPLANVTDDEDESEENAKASDTNFVVDTEIDFFGNFGDPDQLDFARRAYRIVGIPPARYTAIVTQANDDPSLVLIEKTSATTNPAKYAVKIALVADWPSDQIEVAEYEPPAAAKLEAYGISTNREYWYIVMSGVAKIIPNNAAGLLTFKADSAYSNNLVDTENLAISVQPQLEYQQMFADAWRMLRDYFYDVDMHQVDWPAVFRRYQPLVKRCAKREELDMILALMASELSALHVFVYGGEYASPLHGIASLTAVHSVASLGASLTRNVELGGYVINDIFERDPDFNYVDDKPIYAPLSRKTLGISGQRGLKPGDVILGINGESVLTVPDVGYLLRGQAGRSVRLDVLRKRRKSAKRKLQKSANLDGDLDGVEEEFIMEEDVVVVVPITKEAAADLRYAAWEYHTRKEARRLAAEAGFTIGYMHLRDMSGRSAMDAFVRGYFPDYNKDAMIIDVRHNRGGNIDSWLLDVLQKQAWTYWESRSTNITTGGEGWDGMFAFRGHLVVLVDEGTSSDGEGFSRGVSELGLGTLIGTRTWGGGIWLSSDNTLVDGGIASAPEIGTYNNKFGWGMGIENEGVEPDVVVDNNPREAYDGIDLQLQEAITYLQKWLKREPIVLPKRPGPHPNKSVSMEAEGCPASY